MILKALYDLAVREDLVTDPDFEIKPVSWIVRVGDAGKLMGIEYIKQPEQLPPESKKKPKMIGQQMYVPYQGGRTGNDKAYFLVDKSEYALGIDPTGERDPEKLEFRLSLFVNQIEQCWKTTKEKSIEAVYLFLSSLLKKDQTISLPDGCLSNDLFAFAYLYDDKPVHAQYKIKKYWNGYRINKNSIDILEVICSVEGKMLPVANKVPLIKNVPGGSTSGIAFVSFNESAFESYGWKEKAGKSVANARISEDVAIASMAALNRLLHPSPPDPHDPNQLLHRQNIHLSSDTVVCYWTKEQDELADAFGLAIEVNSEKMAAKPEQIREMYRSLWKGVPFKLKKADQFYSLVLSGGQGRATVRDWIESNTQKVADSLAQYFKDLKVVRCCPAKKGESYPESYALPLLLESLADPKDKRKEGVPSSIGTYFYRASIDQRLLFPQAAYQRALLRYRAELGKESDSWFVKNWNDARAAIIKAYLNRKWRKESKSTEVTEAMNPYCADKGYLLGQLMAVLEKLQQAAMGKGVNATIVDRYFSGASTSPKSVFGSLLRNARHHASKAKDDQKKRWLVERYEDLIDQLCSQFEIGLQNITENHAVYSNGFPSTLSHDEQGMFVLGYHQMRHWLKWKTKEEQDAWNKEHAGAPKAYLWIRKENDRSTPDLTGEKGENQ